MPTAAPSLLTHDYLWLPYRLVRDLHDSPLAIGIFSLIARRFLVTHGPVPLSATEICTYDGAASRGAVVRALRRLVALGWLVELKHSGGKTQYTPAWGFVKGVARPWQIGAALLDRPRHVQALRLDRRLLDLGLGKLTPDPNYAAQIDRYVTAPLWTLADIGRYALALAGLPSGDAPALTRWGLLEGGRARALPGDAELLARASQMPLLDDASATLTGHGLRKLGMAPLSPGEDAEGETGGQVLVYLERDRIGGLIDSLIAQTPSPVIGESAPERGEAAFFAPEERITGIHEAHEGMTFPPPNPPPAIPGGGSGSAEKGAESGAAAAAPDTDAARTLRAFNVRPAVVAELADTPIHVVEAAIADAQARPGVRDQAAWAVSLIRDARKHGWRITGYRSRAQQETVDWAKVIADMRASGLISDEPDDPETLAEVLDAPPPRVPIEVLGVRLRERLRWMRRELGPIIERVEVVADGETPVLACRTVEDATALQVVLPQIATVLRELGWDAPPQLALITPPPAPPPAPERRPAWIATEQWQQLPGLVRAALAGSELEGGAVRAASAYQQKLLITRYAETVAALMPPHLAREAAHASG